eukprot:m.81563 g.81563  ORF g.81563 m.81563 type:complete len:456 (+) comp14696_c0_seq3:2014-3381(+)
MDVSQQAGNKDDPSSTMTMTALWTRPCLIAVVVWLLYQAEGPLDALTARGSADAKQGQHLPTVASIAKALPDAQQLVLPACSAVTGVDADGTTSAPYCHSSAIYQPASPATEPGQRPLVVLVHGFPDTALSFAPMVKALSEAGYDTLAPTLLGYEPSSLRSASVLTITSLAADVPGWLQSLNRTSAHFVGHDYGSLIAGRVAQVHPDLVDSTTLLAVPSNPLYGILQRPDQLLLSYYMFVFQFPLVPLVWLRLLGGVEYLVSSWSAAGTELPAFARANGFNDALQDVFREHPHLLMAAVTYYRHNFGLPLLLTAMCIALPLMARRSAVGYVLFLLLLFGGWSIRAVVESRHPSAAAANVVPAALQQAWDNREVVFALSQALDNAPTLAISGLDDGCMLPELFNISMSNRPELFHNGRVDVEFLQRAGHWAHLEHPDTVHALIKTHIAAATKKKKN